jgi:CO dehydrogenase nickel-insertion accessory protein CooC1
MSKRFTIKEFWMGLGGPSPVGDRAEAVERVAELARVGAPDKWIVEAIMEELEMLPYGRPDHFIRDCHCACAALLRKAAH